MGRNCVIGGLGAALFTLAIGGHAHAQSFDQEVVISNLTLPTALEFSPDGRVFVAEKRGTIKVYSSLTDATPDTFVDLSQGVMSQSDRGLLGMALHPNFPSAPYVYVLYMTVRPKTSELWIGDVGWGAWEEINRIADPSDAIVENFGWPCYEGTAAHGGYGARQFCKDLKAGTLGAPASLSSPVYEYKHGQAPGLAACRVGGSDSAISGIEFYAGGDYPNALDGSLLFTDVRRNCVWAIKAGSDGLPDAAAAIETVLAGASSPVDLRRGPNGDIYYVAHGSGTVRRIYWNTTNQRPTAKITAEPTFGFPPLQVSLRATDSTDPEGGNLTYAWDLDADGEFDDSTLGSLSYTVQKTGTETIWLRVSDGEKEATTSLPLTANNSPPSLSITKPLLTELWSVGDTLTIEGSASDLQDGVLAPSQVRIDVSLHDCGQGACATSLLATLVGITKRPYARNGQMIGRAACYYGTAAPLQHRRTICL